ncbi:hypothetical protein PHMEG_00027289, partial [Phytophthora megakarya]
MTHRQPRGVDPELFTPIASNSGNDSARHVKTPSSSRGSDSQGPRNDISTPITTSHQLQQDIQSHPNLTIELEHLSGYTGKGKNTIHAHPTDSDSYITCMGSAVVIGKIHDAQSQELLCAHEEEINGLSLSSTGTFLASAQVPPH